MTWTTIAYPFASILTSTKMVQNQDNFAAVANEDTGAPRIMQKYLGLRSKGTGALGSVTISANTIINPGVYNYGTLTVNSGVMVTLTGQGALVFLCQSECNLYGTLNAQGRGGFGGGAPGVNNPGNGGEGDFVAITYAGVAGGNGGAPSAGGGGSAYLAAGGGTLKTTAAQDHILLSGLTGTTRGGAGGGSGGGSGGGAGGAGGAGGGLVICVGETITFSGVINVGGDNGFNGAGGGVPSGGGGGGGGGGTVILEAKVYSSTVGSFQLDGGVGGAGVGISGTGGGTGGAGWSRTITL